MKTVKKTSALLIANGHIEEPANLLELLINQYHFNAEKFLIVSADGALKNCSGLNLVPDLVIGDMDSLCKEDENNLRICNPEALFIKSVCEKDESDTQLALEYLAGINVKNIILIGALGKRMDHSLANLINISSQKLENTNIKIIDGNFEISVLRKSAEISGVIGNTLSIFSLTPHTYFIDTDGLKYKLHEEKLMFCPIRGLSNEFVKEKTYLNFKDGILLLMKEIRK
ncbi:MAG: thiamine diphosphokinase [Candidatus Humimicrobiaceae bacterium]